MAISKEVYNDFNQLLTNGLKKVLLCPALGYTGILLVHKTTVIFKATFFLDSPDWAQLEVQVGEQEH